MYTRTHICIIHIIYKVYLIIYLENISSVNGFHAEKVLTV